MPLETFPIDVSEYLDDGESERDFLDAAFSTNDDALVAHAIGLIAKARGMTAIARDAGVQRAHLYRALSARGHPELATIMKVLQSLGLRLSVVAAPPSGEAERIAAE